VELEPTGQRLKDHEKVGHAVANILTVVVSHLPRSGRDRREYLADSWQVSLLGYSYPIGKETEKYPSNHV